MTDVKSRPAYVPLAADLKARDHLLVAETAGLESVLRVLEELGRDAAPVELYWLGDLPATLAGRTFVSAFDKPAALAEALRERLSRSAMGLRLYLAGTEAFVWEAGQPARAAGLREDEIRREACETAPRRVFCVHCRHILEAAATHPVICPGCGLALEVRDHFSPALAAYLGVFAASGSRKAPEPEERLA